MKILVTGANGFVGKNLTATLANIQSGKDKTFPLSPEITVFAYDLDTPEEYLDTYTKECDFVFHLAGVTAPKRKRNSWKGILDLPRHYLTS